VSHLTKANAIRAFRALKCGGFSGNEAAKVLNMSHATLARWHQDSIPTDIAEANRITARRSRGEISSAEFCAKLAAIPVAQ